MNKTLYFRFYAYLVLLFFCLFRKFYSPFPREEGVQFLKKKKKLKINPLSLILRKFSIIFFIQLSAGFCWLQYLRFYFWFRITRTINVYIVNVLSFLNIRWLTVKVNLVLALKAVKKIVRLRNQSSLNLRELRKEIWRISTWYLWIKQEKGEVCSWPKVRVSN